MKIVVDQNIPFGSEAFSSAGEVVRLPGRQIAAEHLRDASALIVRSITRVDERLLKGTPVRFVGTCTIGTDHLDIPWLESNGISWCSAPGCNARSVAEHAIASLALAQKEGRIDLASRPKAGVVGVGHVGRIVAELLEALELEVLRNDPPREENEGPHGFSSLERLLRECRIVCAHLPLTRTGTHPTQGLLDADHLGRLPSGALFLNAGRGATAPSSGLRRLIQERPDISLALDVWDPEPAFPVDIARTCLVRTPHVAGYSFEGKIEGTRMVREEFGRVAGLAEWNSPHVEPDPVELPRSVVPSSEPWSAWSELVLAAYDIVGDSSRMSEIADRPDSERASAFDRLRKDYPVRREFRNRPVIGWERLPDHARKIAETLGFREARTL